MFRIIAVIATGLLCLIMVFGTILVYEAGTMTSLVPYMIWPDLFFIGIFVFEVIQLKIERKNK